jgi:uncharacterized membrane protein YraQ (UPF0718 family)
MLPKLLGLLCVLGFAGSGWRDPGRTKGAFRSGLDSLGKLTPSLVLVSAGVGLSLALVPPHILAKLFKLHGVAGFLVLSAVGSLITIPGPLAYQVAGNLHRMGATLPALASFITTLTLVGVISAPQEAATFGRRFTLARQALSLGLALAVGALMGVLL